MKEVSKLLMVFINLCNMAVGIAVAVILLFKKDFVSVFYITGMSSNESLFFNLTLFQLGLALVGIVIGLMTGNANREKKVIEFPIFYEIIPIIISVICIYYGIMGETIREKLIVCICAVLYAVLSAVVIYSGARIFQLFPGEKKK